MHVTQLHSLCGRGHQAFVTEKQFPLVSYFMKRIGGRIRQSYYRTNNRTKMGGACTVLFFMLFFASLTSNTLLSHQDSLR